MYKDPSDIAPRNRRSAVLPRKLLAATALAACSLFSCATIAGSYDDALGAARLGDTSQLTGLLDGISNGIQTIQTASKGIDGITKLVQSLQSTVKQAPSSLTAAS